jgi:hypothetical protein
MQFRQKKHYYANCAAGSSMAFRPERRKRAKALRVIRDRRARSKPGHVRYAAESGSKFRALAAPPLAIAGLMAPPWV